MHFPSLFLLFLFSFITISSVRQARAEPPSKIYGVNLGSWLLVEPWMLPNEWIEMGGEKCDDLAHCISSEFAFAKAYPDKVDQIFDSHWHTWFSQSDVERLRGAGINTVRIPLGYWIVEALVDRSAESYPRGGIVHLRRGLRLLKEAGIQAILDLHGAPGVQTANQSFTGHYTSDVQFYREDNYQRAITWTAVMTALAHTDPDFSSVFAIEAINEPISDAQKTPGYGEFQVDFVQVVRAVESFFGIYDPATSAPRTRGFRRSFSSRRHLPRDPTSLGIPPLSGTLSARQTLPTAWSPMVVFALESLEEIFPPLCHQLGLDTGAGLGLLNNKTSYLVNREPLTTNFMDINWQHHGPANPADAAIGPQAYDDHLYYSFGGLTEANEESYLKAICNMHRKEKNDQFKNNPFWFGEWSIATNFNATDEFLCKWADAQKLQYSSKSMGWIFWNFKIEDSDDARAIARQWSYFEGLERGYFTADPSALHNPYVCDPYYSN